MNILTPPKGGRRPSKQKQSALVLTALWLALVPFRAYAGFTNAGFESNSFASWTVNSLTFGAGLSPYPPTSVAGLGLTQASPNGLTTVVSAGTDANSNGNLAYPLYGTYAAAVNFGGSTNIASSIFQTATITSSDVDPADSKVHIRFAIAPVLENPAHPANEQPFFVVEVKDITKGSTLYFQYNYAGQAGVPWLTGATGFQYTNWQAIDIAPGAGSLDVGDSVSIQVVASRCEPGGHHGYVYVDAGDTGTFVPGLEVDAIASDQNAFRGMNFTYTYDYSNGSSSDVNNVEVDATLPTGSTFVSTTGSSCTAPAVGDTGTVTCSLGTVAMGASGSFAITVLVSNSATNPLNNGTYSISGDSVPTLLGPLVSTPIPDFTLTGPGGGALNTASTNFSVTPNASFTGTITITPAGGGLSTPVMLSFTSSSAPQTFTITPTSVGPVTLTPSNNGGLINPTGLKYETPPDAPTIGTLTAGNGAASVTFTAPGVTGGSAITGYVATCNPGGIMGSGASSPITIANLMNGTAYTCSVSAMNTYGTGDPSSVSNSAMPVAPVSAYTFTGPAGGALNTASSNFTVTPNGIYTGTITITPSGGGISTPIVLTFAGSAASQTFTITPSAIGPVTLTPTNNGGLMNSSALTYATPPAAPTIGTLTGGNGSASLAFTAPGSTGGSPITIYTATCNPGNLTGTSMTSPITVSGLTNGTAYICSVTATNTYGTSPASAGSNSATPNPTSYTFFGPPGGALNTASPNFTVTPNGAFTGTITITPSGGGLSTPIVLTFSNSASAQSFTITPTSAGPVTLTAANSGPLSNPVALIYATPPAAPTIGTLTGGNGSASLAFTAPGSTGGSPITIYTATCNPGNLMGTAMTSPITVSGLTNGTAYTCSVTATNTYGTSPASAASNSATPNPTNYTFFGPPGGALNTASPNFTVTPNGAFTGTITITPSGGGLSTPIVLTFSNSASAQSFTITPTSAGPVTLTAANSGPLSNPVALIYATPPAAPTIGTLIGGNGSASLAFTAPGSTGGSPITIYTATCNPGNLTGTSMTSPITVSGLTNGTAYICSVTATNTYGTSPASAGSNSATPNPTNYTFTGPLGGAINTASSNFTVTPNGAFTGTITITPSGGGLSTPIVLTFTNSAVAETFTITPTLLGPISLTPATSEPFSNPASLTYATPPAAPTIGTVTAGNGSASVTFSAPALTGGSPITTYTATCNPGNLTGTSVSSPTVVNGLVNGKNYTCSIAANNAFGSSSSSPAASVTPGVIPGPPLGVSAVAGNGLAIVSFSPPYSNEGSPVVTYTIIASPGGLSVQSTGSPVTVSGLTNGASYTFSVFATNGFGSGPSATSNSVIPIGPPGPPQGVSAAAGDGQATISFMPPANNGGSPILSYTVVSSPGGLSATGTSSPIIIAGLANGTAYTFFVTATNLAGPGPASSTSNSVTAHSGAGPGLTLTSPTFPVGVAGNDYPLQILMASGGMAPYTFSIAAASLPPGLTFASPQLSGIPITPGTFTFTITVTDALGNSATALGTILINAVNPDLILSASTVNFTLMSGSSGVPLPASVTVRSSDIQQLLNYSVTMTPPVPWLNVLGGGTTPGSITLGLSPAALSLPTDAAPYQTTVIATCITPSPCAGRTKIVTLSLNVGAANPSVALTRSLLSFEATTAATTPLSQEVGIQNVGGGQFNIVGASPSDGWLSVAGVPSVVVAGTTATMTVTVDPTALSVGFYTGSLTVSTSAGSIVLPVDLRISPAASMSLVGAGAQFQTTLGTALGNANGSMLVATTASSAIAYSVTVAAGADWITLGDTSGTASDSQPGTVHFTVNPPSANGAQPQTYYGLIRVTAPGAVNSPLDYEVVLDVQPASSPVKPQPSPAGLLFTSSAANASASQPVQVFASSTNPQPYQASAATQDGASWLSVAPPTGFASSSGPAQSTVSTNAAGLAPGIYRGGVSYAFSSEAVRTVSVTLIVSASTSCVPSRLVATQIAPAHNFEQPRGWPTELLLKVTDDCGAPSNNADVVASFSNGDPQLGLTPVDDSSGMYAGAWVPLTVSPQVTVDTTVDAGSQKETSVEITGKVTDNQPPLLAQNSVQQIFNASVGAPLAPGSIVEISGTGLAGSSQSMVTLPLPLTLAGTSVLIGGLPAPLYAVSPGRIVAQVPFELTPGGQYQVEVSAGGVLSATNSFPLVPVAPAIAAAAAGEAIAQHSDFSPISAASPARPGEIVTIYVTGMGATDVPVASGAASPSNPLAHPLVSPTITVNGAPVQIAFAGLTPDSVGIYQINFQMPDTLPNGVADVQVTQAGASSNTVTIAVAAN